MRHLIGEITGRQSRSVREGLYGVASSCGTIPTFGDAPPPSYALYRAMSEHPTIALAFAVVSGPILAGSWTFEARKGTSDAQVDFIRQQLEPRRAVIIGEMLRALQYGWRPFEIVYQPTKQGWEIRKLKSLLPELTDALVDEHGNLIGLRQGEGIIPAIKSFVFTCDQESDNYYGRSRNENIRQAWWKWIKCDQRGDQLATKVASIVPMVHYPPGAGVGADGSRRTNFEQAQQILSALSSGRGVAMPNLYSSGDHLSPGEAARAADLAGKSQWVISFLEATSASENLKSITDRQRYYDSLMMRGWLVPERTALEGRFGTKAEAESHADIALNYSQLLDQEMSAAINSGLIDPLLEMNFGAESAGSVYITPAPLVHDHRLVFKQILTAVLGDSRTLGQLLSQVDMDAVIDALGIPKGSGIVEMSDPNQPAAVAAAAAQA